eukprot:TRINITY_DN3287_c0_g1_i12.p1 TRINITY_DN3287_c0_g1~~TRINITY_DN3287_c0_g1_i12.p1  ORF type:complete len:567 (-),score=63.98 TRINITY_DN3287_c0_g1_i12:1455-3155(-)
MKLMHDDTQNNELNEELLSSCIDVINRLDYLMTQQSSNNNLEQLNNFDVNDLWLPGDDNKLHKSMDLVYNDRSKSENERDIFSDKLDVVFVNRRISNAVAEKLGVVALSRYILSIAIDSGFEAYGKKQDLITGIQEILHNHADFKLFSEFVQNAEDAGATKLKFIFDSSTYPTQTLLSPSMASYQGPSLIIYNNAPMTEEDFKAINHLRSGHKKEKRDMIGQFGTGLNIAYHLTDLISIISGDQHIVFDPQLKYLPNVANKYDPGIKINLQKFKVLNMFQDQFEPFKVVLNDIILRDNPRSPSLPLPQSAYKITAFRLPLRSIQVSSKISYKIPSQKILREQCIEQLPKLIIFLKNIKNIEVLAKDSIDSPLKCLASCTTSRTVSPMKYSSARTDSNFTIEKSIPDQIKIQEHWSEITYSETPSTGKMKHVSVAALKKRIETNLVTTHSITDVHPVLNGELFCTLPLFIPTNLPVHISGSFHLNSARSDFCHNENYGTEDLKVVYNNDLLFKHALSSYNTLIDRSLKEVKSSVYSQQFEDLLHHFYDLWPTCDVKEYLKPLRKKNI